MIYIIIAQQSVSKIKTVQELNVQFKCLYSVDVCLIAPKLYLLKMKLTTIFVYGMKLRDFIPTFAVESFQNLFFCISWQSQKTFHSLSSSRVSHSTYKTISYNL